MRYLLSWLLFTAVLGTAQAQLDATAVRPPVAKQVTKTLTIHGDPRVDHYNWLREKSTPEVIAHLEAENAYTATVMKPVEGLQEQLYKEMLARIKQSDLTVPYQLGGWWYYARTEQGKQYPIQCRKQGSLDASEQVMLDLNELAQGQKFLSLGASVVSDDAGLLAYSIDVTGFRQYKLHIKDLRSGMLLPDRIEKVNSVVWAADNRSLFYVTEDAAKRPFRLYRHVLGRDKDDLIYEEKDELFRLAVRRTRDKAFVLVESASSTTTEVRLLPSDRPGDSPRVILPRAEGHEYHIDHRDGLLYVRTNRDAKNFRLVTAPLAEPATWTELVPHRPAVLLEGVDLFGQHCVLSEREDGLPHLAVLDFATKARHRIEFPEPTYAVFRDPNPEFKTTQLRFRYQSLVTPDSVFDYDMATRQRKLLKQSEVLGGYDPSQYASERIFATATDGTQIPISLVYRKDQRRKGGNPLLLYGYGAYGFSAPVTFASSRLSLLDRGVVYAIAHIRGGKEMGKFWHDQGKMLNKRNTFTDFIAAGDHLVAAGFTTHQQMAIQGGSAGGLLIGAVVNLRPDLARVAILEVPFVDVINTMLDASLPLTIQEYLEWGNPNLKAEYDYMKSYCPYTNLAKRNYPAMLVRTSLNDSQVMYFEPAKYVAKLRTLKTDANVLLFRCNMAAGHGGASGRYDALRETAFSYAFLLAELGIRP